MDPEVVIGKTVYSEINNSSQNIKYEVIDELPFGGLSYYRLIATDMNGFSEFHGVVALKLNESVPDVLLYPNPVTEHYMIISYSGIRETTCKILNITGIQYEEKVLKPGINLLVGTVQQLLKLLQQILRQAL